MSDGDMIAKLHGALVEAAQEAGEGAVELVSVNFDRVGSVAGCADAIASTEIDRRTRTMVFLHGDLRCGAEVALTATAVFRKAAD